MIKATFIDRKGFTKKLVIKNPTPLYSFPERQRMRTKSGSPAEYEFIKVDFELVRFNAELKTATYREL